MNFSAPHCGAAAQEHTGACTKHIADFAEIGPSLQQARAAHGQPRCLIHPCLSHEYPSKQVGL